MKKTFDQKGAFAAVDAAEAWCKENGVSVGTMQHNAPRGLKRGDCVIAKWRNLDKADRKELDGTMIGDFRNGPVFIDIRDAVTEDSDQCQ